MLTGRCRRTTKSLGLTVVGLMPTTRNISMLVAAAVIALGGCVSFTTTLIDRRAGDWQTCESSGWGTVGVRRAALRNAMCVETFKNSATTRLLMRRPPRERLNDPESMPARRREPDVESCAPPMCSLTRATSTVTAMLGVVHHRRRFIDSLCRRRPLTDGLTRDAMARLRAKGRRTSRWPPFGYAHQPDGRLIEVVEEQAVVRRIAV